MISRKFRVEEHPDFGTLGLSLVGMPWAEPFPGMAAAHDVLEHFPNDDGSIEAEYMALGASLLVRDGSNYYASKGQNRSEPYENIGSEIVSQYHYAAQRRSFFVRDPGRTLPLSDDYAEDQIQRTADESRRVLLGEFDGDDRQDEAREFVSAENLARLVGWMRKGYRRAARRFAGVPSWRLLATFQDIERKADAFLAHAEEGMTITVRCRPQFDDVQLIEPREVWE